MSVSISKKLTDALWTEKYRPSTLEEIVMPDNYRELVSSWLNNPSDLPNLILVGNPGTGKTTTARLLIRNIIKSEEDYLEMNGSSDRGITVIREDITSFVRLKPVSSQIKIVFIDEADNLTQDAFKALRAVMETSKTTRFVLTGNYDTFPDAMKSRCRVLYFPDLHEDMIYERCKEILENEKIIYNDSDIKKLIKLFKPDMRKIIGYLQLLSSNKVFDITKLDIHVDNEDKIIIDIVEYIDNENLDEQYKKQLLNKIYTFLIENPISYNRLIKTLFEKYKSSVNVSCALSYFQQQLQNSLIPQPYLVLMIDRMCEMKKL